MEYLTVARTAQAELIERRSRFIGVAAPAADREAAEALLAEQRALYRDATHHCFACLINSGEMRASDDGEPSGTAGTPMLEVLKKENLMYTAVVVTRYFGGVLLGAGGLIRAYGAAAKAAVDAAGIVRMAPCRCFNVHTDYADGRRLEKLIADSAAVLTDTVYAERVCFSLYIRDGLYEELTAKLTDAVGGRLRIEPTGSRYCAVQP